MNSKKLIIIAALLLVLPVGFPLGITVTPDSPSTKQSETVTLDFLIENSVPTDQSIAISTTGSYADWVTVANSVNVGGYGKVPVKVYLTPPRGAAPGVYGFRFIATAYPSGDSKEQEIFLRVLKKEGYYLKSLEISKDGYTYGEPVVLLASIQSNEPVDADVTLNVKVDGPKRYSQNFVYTLPADKAQEFTSNLQMPGAPAGTYHLTATLQRGLRTFDTKIFSFQVQPTVNVEQQKKSHFLVYKILTTIEVENVGNVEAKDVQVADPVPTAWAVLTSSEKPFSTGATGFVWNIPSLSPGEGQKISYEIALWPLYIIMMLVAYGAYKTYAHVGLPGITKTIAQRGPLTRGSEARVLLHVKNKSFKPVKNVIVDDSIPAAFQIVDASVPKPKIRVSGTGQNVRWNLGTLGPREERVLSYRVKQNMGVIGKILLPKAWLKADDSTYRSNEVSAQGEHEKKSN